ncbi:MAG: DUF1501 domain-containing protein [Planctomycetaceae bacterium]
MQPSQERYQNQLFHTRRQLFGKAALGVGTAALSSLLLSEGLAANRVSDASPGTLGASHHQPKAKRIISLVMNGGPSQLDMFDYKPQLKAHFDQELPDSVRMGQRITTMTSGQARFPVAPSKFKFNRCGESGALVSELLPKFSEVVDDVTIVKSIYTEAINHDPAITYLMTGSQLPGRPSAGAWVSYGLGSMNRDLPTYVVLHSSWTRGNDQAIYERLWGPGFLPTTHQGVSLRTSGDPVLFLSNPPGVSDKTRRQMLDGLAKLNSLKLEQLGDPEINTRIAQYEMAYRMQFSIPELTDIADETQSTLDLYGPDVHKKGTFSANCLLARRLAERNVRFIQIYLRGWDQHGNLPGDIALQCKDVDHGMAGLIKDLKQRGMLDDTLVVWGGEFGRTVYSQGTLTNENYGRDHHPRNFCYWLAGGGIKGGLTYGETDDFSYNIVDKPVHIHDLNATIMHCLGIDHERLTFRYQGRDFRLTDIHGNVVRDILV